MAVHYRNDKDKKWNYELVYRNQESGDTYIWGYDTFESANSYAKILRIQQPELEYPHIVITVERTKDFKDD